jgi:hypothetical protein
LRGKDEITAKSPDYRRYCDHWPSGLLTSGQCFGP